MAQNRLNIKTATQYYKDLAFYLSEDCEETLEDIARYIDVPNEKLLGDMVTACIKEKLVEVVGKNGRQAIRKWVGGKVTEDLVRRLEDRRVIISRHIVEKATWAALIKKGEAPTVEELTAVMALCTPAAVVTAFRARRNME